MKTGLSIALLKQKKILEAEGYTVAYICIYGSQNYGLDIDTEEYQSDIDMKAIIVPTLDELVKNSKPVSKTIETEWGQCDVKDIRTYFETLLKANPAYIETLFTQYYIVDDKFKDEFEWIFRASGRLVWTLRGQFIRAMYGMMCEKQKALCHPYPSIAHKIEKFGFDGKQLHHIHRLYFMMTDYFIHDKKLSECFYPPSNEIGLLQSMKTNSIYDVEEAKSIAEDTLMRAREIRDVVLEGIDEKRIDYSVKDKFLEMSQEIIKNKIIVECGGFVE